MTMKKLFIFLFLFSFLHAQLPCGTPDSPDSVVQKYPWYGNNRFLYDYADSAGLFNTTSYSKIINGKPYEVPDADFFIPVRFVFVNNPDNDATLYNYIQGNLDIANEALKDAKIYLYNACQLERIDKDKFNGKVWNCWQAGWRLPIILPQVNVFIVETIDDAAGLYCSHGLPANNALILVEKQIFNNPHYKTFIHEIGHYFSLEHTHRNYDKGKCRQEPVDRNQKVPWYCRVKALKKGCEVNGDLFCDTEADFENSNDYSNGCKYTGTKTDKWGLKYKPDEKNIMSYWGSCREHFSPMQLSAMHWSAGMKDLFGTLFRRSRFKADFYEPDNYSYIARSISINTPQHHTFHWTRKTGLSTEFCDTDWMTFQTTSKADKFLRIETLPGHFENANTYVYVFDNTLNLVAKDNDSGQGNFSKLYLQTQNSQKYYIKVIHFGGFSSPNNRPLTDYLINVYRCVPYETACVRQSQIDPTETDWQKFYAWNYLYAPCENSTLVIPAGTKVLFQSEGVIDLNDGFYTEDGAEFIAEIAPLPISTCDENKLTEPWNLTEKLGNTSQNIFASFQENRQEAIEKSENLQIFPNPTSDKFTIEIPEEGCYEIQVQNLVGQTILQEKTCESKTEISMQKFPSGIYFVKVSGEKSYFGKIVKQ